MRFFVFPIDYCFTKTIKNMKKTLLIAAFAVLAIAASAQDSYVGQPTNDTWVRSNSINSKGGSSKNLEIKTYSSSEPATNFYALMQFEFTAPTTGNEVKSATLRLTTRYKKGDSEVKIYALNCDVDENNTDYEQAGGAIEAAIAGEPIATFKLNGDGSKAPTDAIADEFKTVDKWQNTIDLSTYVRSLTTNKFAIVLQKTFDQNNSSQIYSKEATDETLKDDAGVFAAADLQPQLTVEYQEAQDQRAVVKGSVADLWVWSTNPDATKSGNTVELRTNGEEKMYGLMSFTFEAPAADEEIHSASLRLVTRFKKGDSEVNVYGFGADIDESSTTYNTALADITTALATEPIANFKAKGCAQWAPTDKAVTEEYTTVAAWTNTIDLTDYVKGLSTNKLTILLQKTYEQNNSTQFWTKEATDISNHAESSFTYTFKAEDLVPQLTVVYKKNSGETTAINTPKQENRSSEGIYTLSGQRVEKMGRGIYIVNGKKIVNK